MDLIDRLKFVGDCHEINEALARGDITPEFYSMLTATDATHDLVSVHGIIHLVRDDHFTGDADICKYSVLKTRGHQKAIDHIRLYKHEFSRVNACWRYFDKPDYRNKWKKLFTDNTDYPDRFDNFWSSNVVSRADFPLHDWICENYPDVVPNLKVTFCDIKPKQKFSVLPELYSRFPDAFRYCVDEEYFDNAPEPIMDNIEFIFRDHIKIDHKSLIRCLLRSREPFNNVQKYVEFMLRYHCTFPSMLEYFCDQPDSDIFNLMMKYNTEKTKFPAIVASAYGHVDYIERLYSEGFPIDYTCLIQASKNNQLHVLKVLITKMGQIPDQNSVLFATAYDAWECLEYLETLHISDKITGRDWSKELFKSPGINIELMDPYRTHDSVPFNECHVAEFEKVTAVSLPEDLRYFLCNVDRVVPNCDWSREKFSTTAIELYNVNVFQLVAEIPWLRLVTRREPGLPCVSVFDIWDGDDTTELYKYNYVVGTRDRDFKNILLNSGKYDYLFTQVNTSYEVDNNSRASHVPHYIGENSNIPYLYKYCADTHQLLEFDSNVSENLEDFSKCGLPVHKELKLTYSGCNCDMTVILTGIYKGKIVNYDCGFDEGNHGAVLFDSFTDNLIKIIKERLIKQHNDDVVSE